MDIDDPALAARVCALTRSLLGETIIRTRKDSGRCLLLYRAAEGEPSKLAKGGTLGKVEILGAGQQFVAFGIHHPSGSRLEWPNGGPDTMRRDALPAITEEQVSTLLDAVAALVGGRREPNKGSQADGANPDRRSSTHGLTADPELVASALEQIPNEDAPNWEAWNTVLMATWNATEVKGAALEAARAWSEKNPAHCDAMFDERWKHYTTSPPSKIGAGSLFRQAHQATGWIPRQGLTADDVDAMLSDDARDVAPPEDRYRLYTPADCANAPSRGYVVKGLIAPGDVVCIFGPPAAGKSLLAPSLGYKVALGQHAFGLRVRQGKVLYVAAEDLHGMRGRVTALRTAHGDTLDFLVMGGISDLLTPSSQDLAALRATVEQQRPDLIFLDTVAMAFPGLKENEAEDMGRVVAVARSLTEWGAAVVLIHHDTKARDGTPRGHSILNGALDVAVCLDPRDKDGIVRGRLTKNRNGPPTVPLAFRIETRDAGVDEDGEPIRLPLAVEVTSNLVNSPKLTPSEQAALDALTTQVKLATGPVLVSAWQAECERTRAVSNADKRESRTKAFARASKALERKGSVRVESGHACPATGSMPTMEFDPFGDLTTIKNDS